ncbi:hypothetical protein [Egbenema bharatensis]|uniref:hypothetical protein n=1 Tax=Egbenema bharatensis TaxID=3463334 RepID=UPI003A84FEC6
MVRVISGGSNRLSVRRRTVRASSQGQTLEQILSFSQVFRLLLRLNFFQSLIP